MDFRNNLKEMETNFQAKVDEIKALFYNWMNRNLTVYGKILVVKSLALSKLSHLSLVLPNLAKDQIKQLETLIFKFLWNGKPDKISREHSKLKEKAGGLGVPDIKTFWNGLKFSWFKRMISTEAFWPKILQLEVQDILGHDFQTVDFLQLCPLKYKSLNKKNK